MAKLYGRLFDGKGGGPTHAADGLISATVQNRSDALRVNVNDAGAVSVAVGPSTVASDASGRGTWTFLHVDLAKLAAVASDPRFAEDVAAAYDAAVRRLGTNRPTAQSIYAAMRADAATAGVSIDDWMTYVEDRGGRFGRYVSIDHDQVLVSEDRTSGAWIVRTADALVAELPRTASSAEVAAAAIKALHSR